MTIALVDLVKTYRILKAKREAEEKLFEEEMNRKYKVTENKLSAFMLAYLEKLGAGDGISIRTNEGTICRKERASASLVDKEAFRRHVIGTESWDLLDWKANLTAAKDFIKENEGESPPGVSISSKWTLSCTAPRKKTGSAAEAAKGETEEDNEAEAA